MTAQYRQALETGKSASTEPAACKGLPTSQLVQIAAAIIGGN